MYSCSLGLLPGLSTKKTFVLPLVKAEETESPTELLLLLVRTHPSAQHPLFA